MNVIRGWSASVCCCAMLLCPLSAQAAGITSNFQGPGTDWFQAANWTDGIPTANDDATVNGAKTVISANTAVANNVFVGNVANVIGVLQQTGGTANFDFVGLSNDPAASGTYAMDKVGGGATLNASGIQVGLEGYGEFDQSAGNQVNVGSLWVGLDPASGVYNLNGAKLIASDVVIGRGSPVSPSVGIFNEAVGSTFNVEQDLTLGYFARSSGTFVQNGGTNTVGGALNVGLDQFGQYNQAGGSQHVSGDLNIAVKSDSIGEYRMTGGSLQIDGTIFVGGNAAGGAHGSGTLVADAGLNALSAEALQIAPGNIVKLTGPGGAGGPLLSIDSIDILGGFNPGIWQGSGSIAANIAVDTVFNNSGIVRPGQQNLPGILSIDGGYSQTTHATLGIQIGGTTPGTMYDVLHTTGPVSIDGILSVTLIGGFMPALGNVFDIVTTDNTRAGIFSGRSLPPLPAGLAWTVVYNDHDVQLQVVPEPSSCVLAVMGAFSIVVVRRRALRPRTVSRRIPPVC